MRQNLVLITIDCLRADHCGFMGYARPTTPTLDTLARTSIVFENAQVAGAPTYYSFPAILASRYPLSLGRDILGVSPQTPTLATVLRQAGYRTAGFNAGNPYLSRWFGYDQGFDTYDDFGLTEQPTFNVAETSDFSDDSGTPFYRRLNRWVARLSARVPLARELYNELDFRYCYRQECAKIAGAWDKTRHYPNATQVTERVLAWLKTQAQAPFFLWVHYMDPHHPRYPSPHALSAIGARTMTTEHQFFLNSVWRRPTIARRYQDELMALYDAGIHETDSQIGRLIHELGHLAFREQTALVVLGDHGEEFFEHGGLGHSPPSLYQSLTHVPVLLQTPSGAAKRIASPLSLIDLAPTMLAALGLGSPPTFQGVSRWEALLHQSEWDDPAISEIVRLPREPRIGTPLIQPRMLALRHAHYKLILDLATGTDQLYDVATDPLEQHPLAITVARKAHRRLLLAAREHLRRTRVRPDDPTRLRARVGMLRQQLEKARTV